MFKPKTYTELCAAMQTRAEVEIDGNTGIINGIAPEDGSGHAWNVTLLKEPNHRYGRNGQRAVGEEQVVFFRE